MDTRRILKTAGNLHDLIVNVNSKSKCGDIVDGVVVHFDTDQSPMRGHWVIDFDDLKLLVSEIEQARAAAPPPKETP